MIRCAHCGKPLYDHQDEILMTLTPTQRAIFELVTERPRTMAMLHETLYGLRPDGGPQLETVKVHVWKANARLIRFGLQIVSNSRRHYGEGLYRIIRIDSAQEAA